MDAMEWWLEPLHLWAVSTSSFFYILTLDRYVAQRKPETNARLTPTI